MLIVIDESGCTGFKPASSTHFVLGMVVFKTFQDAEETANMINKLKQETGSKREFHFNSCNNNTRDTFFRTIRDARFTIRLFIIEKRLIHSKTLKTDDDKFINYSLKCLMKDASHIIQDAVIKIDGTGSKHFKRGCKSYLRRELPSGTIRDLIFCDSKKDVLIQLADMVVSAYSRPYNKPGKADAFKWRNLIEDKIEKIWYFR